MGSKGRLEVDENVRLPLHTNQRGAFCIKEEQMLVHNHYNTDITIFNHNSGLLIPRHLCLL